MDIFFYQYTITVQQGSVTAFAWKDRKVVTVLSNDSSRQLLLQENIDPNHYGVDEDGTFTTAVDEESLVICDPPRLPFILTDSQREQLAQCQAATQVGDDFWISQCNAILQLLEHWNV